MIRLNTILPCLEWALVKNFKTPFLYKLAFLALCKPGLHSVLYALQCYTAQGLKLWVTGCSLHVAGKLPSTCETREPVTSSHKFDS